MKTDLVEKVGHQVASLSVREIFSSEYWVDFWRDASSSVITALGQILLILVLFFIVRFGLFKVIDRILTPILKREEAAGAEMGRASRIMTLKGLVKSVSGYVIGFIAGIMILRALGVDPIPALTTAGVAALAVGFGAQLMVRDVITGFFILLENQYAVGDYVTIGGVSGVVEEIGMRITKLRDDVGKLVIIANGTVSQVINHSRGSLLTSVEISVPTAAALDKAVAVMNEVGSQIKKDRKDVLSAFKTEGIAAMDAAKVTFKITGRVAPLKQDTVVMELRSRLLARLNDEGIGIV